MDWRIKCVAFHVLRFAPRRWYCALQQRVTGRFLFNVTESELAAYSVHANALKEFAPGGRALEFGCGSNLLSSLLLSAAGAAEVFAYDLNRIATLDQVNHVIRQLRTRGGDWPEITDLEADLLRKYRIHYRAPADARHTGLPDGHIDFVCSTSVLEHIPENDIRLILAECRRICRPAAALSMIIDYHDHYATADPTISRINFYRYPAAVWQFLSPPNHYQNRLRHSDFERIFGDAQLLIAENRAVVPEIALDRQHMDRQFRPYSDRDLAALNGFFLLGTPPGLRARHATSSARQT